MSRSPINFFIGQHCETTTTGSLLKNIDIDYSESLLFGLGEGLGYIFWNMKSMDFPFIGGRIKPDLLTQNIAKNLNLELNVHETSSIKKAWENVKKLLDNGQMVGLKLDCFYLDYFKNPIHFAGHYAAIYDYDATTAFMIDTIQQGSLVKTSLNSLALARAAKGPMASKNLSYTLTNKYKDVDLNNVVIQAIKNNAKTYLKAPIKNVGYKGILKTSTEIYKWFNSSQNIAYEFEAAATIMEKAGTGGALFRNLYCTFLEEAYQITGNYKIKAAHESFIKIAALWTSISELFLKIKSSSDIKYIDEAASILKLLAQREYETFDQLLKI